MICQGCGAEVEVNEYHPLEFCILVKAGFNPLTVVLDAVRELEVERGAWTIILDRFA